MLVSFDNGKIGTYVYGLDNKYDVQKVNEPRLVPPGHIEIGCLVKRGMFQKFEKYLFTKSIVE